MEIVDLTIDKSKTPSDGTRTPAKTDALSPPPERQSIKQAKTNTPAIMARPNSPDTVSENPIPPIIILDNDQARPNTTDTVPTQAITEPEVMEIVDLTIDKSKTPSDGTRTPAKTDALSPPPERQSIKQAKTCTPTIMTRPKSPDSVPRHPFQPLRLAVPIMIKTGVPLKIETLTKSGNYIATLLTPIYIAQARAHLLVMASASVKWPLNSN